jgi:hypothetical protein
MLQLDLPFHLRESLRGTFLRSNPTKISPPKIHEVILDALSISIETGANTYRVDSTHRPEPDGAAPFRGMLWPRSLLPLAGGAAIEQQMLFPSNGDAVALSWRLIGCPACPVRLTASPIFSAPRLFSGAGFEIEPETNGGRLTWRPYYRSSKIIADTNGRFVALPDGVSPGAFAFELSPHPSVLIFSSEHRSESGLDPLIGGFLAQLTAERTTMPLPDPLRQLITA